MEHAGNLEGKQRRLPHVRGGRRLRLDKAAGACGTLSPSACGKAGSGKFTNKQYDFICRVVYFRLLHLQRALRVHVDDGVWTRTMASDRGFRKMSSAVYIKLDAAGSTKRKRLSASLSPAHAVKPAPKEAPRTSPSPGEKTSSLAVRLPPPHPRHPRP